MDSTANALPAGTVINPIGWVGRSVLAAIGYVGAVVILGFRAAGSVFRLARQERDDVPGFAKTLTLQLSWMLALGFPLVGLVHIAMGSFLALQAYYGSTFIDGTGAVVGVGLLRNLGGLMTGMTLSGILAARMIPELRRLVRHSSGGDQAHSNNDRSSLTRAGSEADLALERVAAPRIAAAGVACLLLSQWGVAVGTIVGWQASLSMMGLPTETFFLMMLRMMWFRDVVGLVIKGILFGLLPAAICCHEGLHRASAADEPRSGGSGPSHPAWSAAPPLAIPAFRATCLGIVAILIVNMSWFILVYHAVPYYGPTLLKPPSP
jgi:phospholipid/cholesterol/gamma-HCH transport system permease protein